MTVPAEDVALVQRVVRGRFLHGSPNAIIGALEGLKFLLSPDESAFTRELLEEEDAYYRERPF